MCKECFYTCGECTSYPACTSCSSASNRYLSGTSCLPNPGYYDDGTQLAPLCKEGCLTCVSLLVCSTCDTNSFYYMVNNSCAYCNVSFGYFLNLANLQCEMCPMNCLICSSAAVCNLCNLSFNYYLNNSVCYYCNITENWFINYNIQC
jgi:hypothetical protein